MKLRCLGCVVQVGFNPLPEPEFCHPRGVQGNRAEVSGLAFIPHGLAFFFCSRGWKAKGTHLVFIPVELGPVFRPFLFKNDSVALVERYNVIRSRRPKPIVRRHFSLGTGREWKLPCPVGSCYPQPVCGTVVNKGSTPMSTPAKPPFSGFREGSPWQQAARRRRQVQ